MTSTIKTSNNKLFTKIKNYLKRQKAFCVSTCTNGIYAITIFHTDDLELYYQVECAIRHFKLNKQQEPWALDSVEFRHDSAIQASLTALAVPSLAA